MVDLTPGLIRLQIRDAILLGVTRGRGRERLVRKRHLVDRPQLKDDDGDEDDLRVVAKIANNRTRYLNCPDRLRGRRKSGFLPTNPYLKLSIPKLECEKISSPSFSPRVIPFIISINYSILNFSLNYSICLYTYALSNH